MFLPRATHVHAGSPCSAPHAPATRSVHCSATCQTRLLITVSCCVPGNANKRIPVGRKSIKANDPPPLAHPTASRRNFIDSDEDVGLTDESDEDANDEEDSERAAATLLSHCESVSNRLRRSIRQLMPEGGMQSDSMSARPVASAIKQPPNLGDDGLCLKPYQLVGLNWLYLLHKQDLNGVLADEMGLVSTDAAFASAAASTALLLVFWSRWPKPVSSAPLAA
eukprot:SAG31_NODE_84_length_27014_cov_3.743006_26_plen_223_part_00